MRQSYSSRPSHFEWEMAALARTLGHPKTPLQAGLDLERSVRAELLVGVASFVSSRASFLAFSALIFGSSLASSVVASH